MHGEPQFTLEIECRHYLLPINVDARVQPDRRRGECGKARASPERHFAATNRGNTEANIIAQYVDNLRGMGQTIEVVERLAIPLAKIRVRQPTPCAINPLQIMQPSFLIFGHHNQIEIGISLRHTGESNISQRPTFRFKDSNDTALFGGMFHARHHFETDLFNVGVGLPMFNVAASNVHRFPNVKVTIGEVQHVDATASLWLE